MTKTKLNKKKLIHLLLLFLYLCLSIYCQEIDCESKCKNEGLKCIDKDEFICDTKCKPKYGGNPNECYLCNFDDYYYIEDGECKQGCIGSSIIASSKECTHVEDQPDLYKMGNVYYEVCPEYSKIDDSTPNRQCLCQNKYYIEKLNDQIEIYHCLSPVSECPDDKKYHNYNSNECFEICSELYSYSVNNICYPEAKSNFIKESKSNKRSLADCDFYKAIDSSESDCLSELDDCFNGGYIYFNLNEKKCWKDIPSYYCIKKNDYDIDGRFEVMPITENYYIDSDKIYCCTSCPSDYPYRKMNSNFCISSCGDEYHKDGDDICYPSCKNIPSGPNGKYLYEIQRTSGSTTENICSDIIPNDCPFYYLNNGIKKCTTSCSSISPSYKFLKGKECLVECNQYQAIVNPDHIVPVSPTITECFTKLSDCFTGTIEYKYYNTIAKKCWTEIPPDYYIKSIREERYEVTGDCGTNLLKYEERIEEEVGHFLLVPKCITFEKCKSLTKLKTIDYWCKAESELTSTNCPFIYNSECKTSCITGTGHDYHNTGSNQCIPRCSGVYPYHKEGEYECYRSCKDISADLIYLKDNICTSSPCSNYYQKIEVSGDDFISKCYESKEDCMIARLKYLKGDNECISECETDEFKVKPIINSDQDIISLGMCLENSEKCKQKGYHFYNNEIKECWETGCKTGFYTMQIGNSGFPEAIEDGSTCVTSCPDGYKLKDNYCIKSCEHFFDEDTGQCEDDCNKYYYEEEKICRSTICTIFKSDSTDDAHICVTECPGNKRVDGNKCVNGCPSDKYFVEEKIEIRGVQRTIKKCIDTTCLEYSNDYGIIYFSEAGKECLKVCHEGFYKIENYCYKKCEGTEKFLNPEDSKCYEDSSHCSGNHYEELLDYPGIYICKSSCETGKFKLKEEADGVNRYECLSECPSGKHFIKGNECSDGCDTGEIEIIKEVKDSYTIYECLPSCPNNGYYSSTNKKCYSICKGNDRDNSFSLTESASGNRKCFSSCDDELYKFYKDDDKVCMINCNLLEEKVTNRCTENCDNEYYKFKFGGTCIHECPNTHKYYLKSNYECINRCPPPTIYLPIEGNECISGCEEGQYKKLENENYRCVNEYGDKYYYNPDKILKDNCNTNHYVVEDTNECVENCDLLENDKYYYYVPDDDDTTNKRKCVLSCLTTNKEFTENNHCKSSCEYFMYYKENEKKCLEDCPPGFSKNGNVCVNPCKTQDPYIYLDNGKCVDHCPNGDHGYKFYIDQEFECIPDCKSGKKFYTEIEISGTDEKEYVCHNICNNFYILNAEISSYAKQCFPDGETCTSKGFYSDENNQYECYENCPPDKYINESPKKCLSQCPKYKYHEKDSKQCKEPEQCSLKIADFESQECVSQCETDYFSEIKDASGNVKAKICLKDCDDDEYGHYLTPNNKCVLDCENDGGEFTTHSTDNKCVCPKLYYFDEESKLIKCLDYDNCYDQSNESGYNIKLYGTAKCLKRCDYIKSLNGELCYKTEEEACKDELDLNSIIKIVGDGKKCECPYKFYEDESNKIHCLREFSDCPNNYDYYIPETMECKKNCDSEGDFTKVFKNFCLRICPPGSTESDSDNNCQCDNFWYSTSDITFICLKANDLCPDRYPAYEPETKECLKKCKGSNYPYLYDGNKCYSGCIYNTQPIDIINDLAGLACVCKKPWFFYFEDGEKKLECPAEDNDDINYCSDHEQNKNFMIHETKECVLKCPGDYPYYFNNECFSNCEIHAESEYHYLKTTNGYECQCKYLWHYKDYTHEIKECFDMNLQSCIENIPEKPYLRIDTNECVEECPPEMKTFNMSCYNKCPQFTLDKQDENQPDYTCTCNKELDSYWYQFEKSYIIPEEEDPRIIIYYSCGSHECPVERPNLLREEKQCLLTCNIGGDENRYKFNLRNICVEKCPKYTDGLNDEKICTFIDLENEELVVDKESLKNYANVQAKELYESRFTIHDGNHLGGFLFNKFEDVSLQIYAIDKGNTLKKYSIKSNLTYIDFDTCLPKIFEDNSMKDSDKILVAKYDLSYWNEAETSNGGADSGSGGTPAASNQNEDDEKHLINKVEYELYNSRTMEKIDASVCEQYEIIISYPIAFNKNRYNNYASGFNNNEYKNKFEKGKNLYGINNELDTFNSNNTLYKDFCLGIEIDGKDLVLEDRYQYLYPNGAVLCESNCTYNRTDFDNERIYCKCSYKDGIDFKRKENEKNDLINDPNFHLPEQSSANLEVIKCLSKLSFKNSIKNNEAFYYCLSITIVVILMSLVTKFYGFKTISKNIINLYSKFESINNIHINNLENTKANNNFNINFNDNIPSTSNRMINNPPKKNNNSEDDNEEDKNIIINKDIEINNKFISLSLKNEDDLIENINNRIDLDNNFKAEYLPSQYNFKYFKSNDKGVRKQIERSNLPFKVNPDTKYLIEAKSGVTYPEDYLKGPFYSNQNIIEIIEKENDEYNISNYKNKSISKEVKYTRNYNNNNKNSNNNNINNIEISPKKRNFQNNLNLNLNMKRDNNLVSKEKKELDYISIKKIKFSKNNNNEEMASQEETSEKEKESLGLFTSIKREQILLRVSYSKYLLKEHSNIISIFLAEILDKVYFVKICLFLKKYEIFGVHLSLYLFCHLLLFTLSCTFFTISKIKLIWSKNNYPGIQYYLLYGLITNIVVWIIYKIFLCLLDIQDNIKDLVKESNKNKNIDIDETNNNEIMDNKFNEIMRKLKFRIIIFYCVIFVFIILFSLYLISFFGIYTGTKSFVMEAYIISIIEILLIKFVYGICLAALRIASKGSEFKSLYKLVYILDKYLS